MDWLSRLFGTRSYVVWVLWAGFFGALFTPETLRAECTVETNGSNEGRLFSVRLSDSCTDAQREARAIPARDVLRVLASGKGIDLTGVVIEGDLLLDELPAQKAAAVQNLSPDDRRVLEGLNDKAVHVIRGPLVMKNVRVRGRIVNRLKQDFLLITGPVVLAQTHFEGAVDLSRTVFLGLVDGSRAIFEQESYFVQDHFTQGAMFSDTHFGPHTRFHRSIFAGPSIFRGAIFRGLTEFLEVGFEQDANFSHASFRMGTGFSGAHCRGKCDFSSAQFDREVFFLFTRFDRAVSFKSARFESPADFSDASFKERDDLAEAVFAQPPLLARTVRVTTVTPRHAGQASSSQTVTIALFLLAFGLLFYIIRSK